MLSNEFGDIAMKCWNGIRDHFKHVETGEFIVMPNHIHGIITISNIVGAQFIAPFGKTTAMNQGVMNHAPTIGNIIRSFKSRCTYMINRLRNTPGNPVWQRNYYEHVIRTEKELNQIREYMVNNPMQWELDTEHPQNIQGSELKHE
jgi:REP element-mobilizing transposase RayT